MSDETKASRVEKGPRTWEVEVFLGMTATTGSMPLEPMYEKVLMIEKSAFDEAIKELEALRRVVEFQQTDFHKRVVELARERDELRELDRLKQDVIYAWECFYANNGPDDKSRLRKAQRALEEFMNEALKRGTEGE